MIPKLLSSNLIHDTNLLTCPDQINLSQLHVLPYFCPMLLPAGTEVLAAGCFSFGSGEKPHPSCPLPGLWHAHSVRRVSVWIVAWGSQDRCEASLERLVWICENRDKQGPEPEQGVKCMFLLLWGHPSYWASRLEKSTTSSRCSAVNTQLHKPTLRL